MTALASLSFSAERLCVTGRIDFSNVAALESEGENWLRQTAPLECLVDLRGVEYCNSAGTALLLSWFRSAAAAGKTFKIVHVPDSLRALMRLAGLEHVLPIR